jgi:hypothetical protein
MMNQRAHFILGAVLLAAIACALPTTPTTPTATSEPLPPTSAALPRIVYTDAGNVWALEEDGTSHQLTSDGGASDVFISDDGARVVYVWRSAPGAHGELRVVNGDGSGGAAVLLTAAQLDAFYPIAEGTVGTDTSMIAFVPGTHRVIFNTYAIPEFMGFMRHDDLWVIDADTAELISLRPGGEGGDFFITPDGSQMALITPTSVSMINTDGTNHRPDLITFPWVITYSEFLFTPLASWNADSSMVAAVIPSEDPLADTISGSIWTIPADTGPATLVATISGNFYFHFWRNPAVSPDMSWVAFTRRVGADDEDLILAHTDGTGEVVYATGEVDWAGWSPDSTHFAYRFGEPSGMTVGALGGAPVPLGPGIDFRWMNDTEFLYLAGSAGAWTLTRGSIGGSTEALVSPAGDFIAYDFAP